MFIYYLRLAMLSFKRNIVLSLLMVSAIALGIGASMTTITVNYLMSSNPIPHKSDMLYAVRVDSWDPNDPYDDGLRPPDQITFTEATNFMRDAKAFRQTANARTALVIEPQGDDSRPFMASVRLNFADFFPMFDTPFLYGSGWDDNADEGRQLVTVLSKETNDRVFGGENSVGRSLTMGGEVYRVVGVLNDWRPLPKFFDVTTGAFDEMEEAYIPFNLKQSLELSNGGNTNCWKPVGEGGFEAFLRSECVNYQMWVELPTEEDKQAYLDYLNGYVMEQKQLGRFERPLDNRLDNVMEWMEDQEVVADDAQMMLYMSFMFLTVCLLNTVGLLLAKFLGKSSEIGLRRAIGASKKDLFIQHIIESGLIGLFGGIGGLFMAWLGLQGISSLYGEFLTGLAELDWVMVITAITLALLSSILAGVYPTWRACSVAPASQLKSQ